MKRMIALFEEENNRVLERYELCIERIQEFKTEETVGEQYRDYFKTMADYLLLLADTACEVKSGKLYKKSLKKLKELNRTLYEAVLPESYETSYANPAYACACFGSKYGKLFTVLTSEIRSLIPPAFEYKLFDMTVVMELFISIYNCMEKESEAAYKEIKELLYYYAHDYYEDFLHRKTGEFIDPSYTFARDIIMDCDLGDQRYLYFFGEYITENELEAAAFLNAMPKEDVKAMADTYVDGYIRGFQVMGADFEKKDIVAVFYCLGFEAMMKSAIERLEGLGKRITVPRVASNVCTRSSSTRKRGYFAVSPNLQYEYDHRFDNGLFLDKKMKERMFASQKAAYEYYKECYALYAGPAVLETFGEPYQAPFVKKEAVSQDKRQKKLMTDLNSEVNALSVNYVKQEEISFTIIAYPLPSIGKQFKEIFAETVRLNTLDNEVYKKIQQEIINALDMGVYCRILGMGSNRTDLKIMLHKLEDPKRETNFENCTADVNIPAGEVFTSPVLKGSCGMLHVGEVFLNGLVFKDLSVTFLDGMTKEYTCKNFEKEEENKRFVEENILKNHKSLPISEFAIGTNTIAYVMGRKYNIQEKLPILIAEKTGPHFAVGDTCYAMSEDHKVYNPDGKEIIARENEYSVLRHTDIAKAYFNCHTDITIPYDEIKEISVYHEDGGKTVIIKNGRFILPGTEKLNEAFED